MPIDTERASRWARALVSNVTRVYPNAPQLILRGDADLRHPADVHPAFYGAFDWHSAVHSHWSLVRLLRTFPDLEAADDVREVLERHLSPGSLEAETDHLRSFPGFERPYGWAWALALATEVDRWADAGDVVAVSAIGELATEISGLFLGFLPRLTYPVRTGTHGNTAFALLLTLDHARHSGNRELEDRAVATARRWYLNDRDAPTAYEPSGEDFLSPSLCEAHLMAEVLETGRFEEWFENFLPGIADLIAPNLADPPTIVDEADARLVHLRGLTLSRAWNWRGVARALPSRDERRVAAFDAADRHLADGLDHVLTGEYRGDHWLVTFALLATYGL